MVDLLSCPFERIELSEAIERLEQLEPSPSVPLVAALLHV